MWTVSSGWYFSRCPLLNLITTGYQYGLENEILCITLFLKLSKVRFLIFYVVYYLWSVVVCRHTIILKLLLINITDLSVGTDGYKSHRYLYYTYIFCNWSTEYWIVVEYEIWEFTGMATLFGGCSLFTLKRVAMVAAATTILPPG